MLFREPGNACGIVQHLDPAPVLCTTILGSVMICYLGNRVRPVGVQHLDPAPASRVLHLLHLSKFLYCSSSVQ